MPQEELSDTTILMIVLIIILIIIIMTVAGFIHFDFLDNLKITWPF